MDQLITLPRVVVEVDGAPLSTNEARALASVRVQQRHAPPLMTRQASIEAIHRSLATKADAGCHRGA